MKVLVQGRGENLKRVDVQDLPVTKEFVKFKKETNELIESLKREIAELKNELEKAKLSNVEIVKWLIER